MISGTSIHIKSKLADLDSGKKTGSGSLAGKTSTKTIRKSFLYFRRENLFCDVIKCNLATFCSYIICSSELKLLVGIKISNFNKFLKFFKIRSDSRRIQNFKNWDQVQNCLDPKD